MCREGFDNSGRYTMIKIEDAVQVILFASLEFRRGEQKVDMICNNWKKNNNSGLWANFIIVEIKIYRANCKRKSVSLEKKLGSRSYKLENESAKNEHKFYRAILHVTFNKCQQKKWREAYNRMIKKGKQTMIWEKVQAKELKCFLTLKKKCKKWKQILSCYNACNI